jgi:hypothetical protein
MIPEAHKQLMESEEYVQEILFPLAIIAAKLIYSRYFSKEAKKCAGKSGWFRSRCITAARVAGMAAQIKELNKHKSKCKTVKNNLDCSQRIEKQIAKLKSQRHKLAIKLVGYKYKAMELSKKAKERKPA